MIEIMIALLICQILVCSLLISSELREIRKSINSLKKIDYRPYRAEGGKTGEIERYGKMQIPEEQYEKIIRFEDALNELVWNRLEGVDPDNVRLYFGVEAEIIAKILEGND